MARLDDPAVPRRAHRPRDRRALGRESAESAHVGPERYEQEGLGGLEDRPRSGARPKADAHYIARLKEAVAGDPRALGYRFSVWSVERLQKHLKRETGIDLSPDYLAELMKKNRIVYRKPKHDLSHKQDLQEVEEKKKLLEFLKKTQ